MCLFFCLSSWNVLRPLRASHNIHHLTALQCSNGKLLSCHLCHHVTWWHQTPSGPGPWWNTVNCPPRLKVPQLTELLWVVFETFWIDGSCGFRTLLMTCLWERLNIVPLCSSFFLEVERESSCEHKYLLSVCPYAAILPRHVDNRSWFLLDVRLVGHCWDSHMTVPVAVGSRSMKLCGLRARASIDLALLNFKFEGFFWLLVRKKIPV